MNRVCVCGWGGGFLSYFKLNWTGHRIEREMLWGSASCLLFYYRYRQRGVREREVDLRKHSKPSNDIDPK